MIIFFYFPLDRKLEPTGVALLNLSYRVGQHKQGEAVASDLTHELELLETALIPVVDKEYK